MENKHTQEPWVAHGTTGLVGTTASGAFETIALVQCPRGLPEMKANARRIVACVNACAGVDTEALESASGKLAVSSSLSMWQSYCDKKMQLEDVIEQRDELLAELEFQRDRNYNPFEPDSQSNNYKRLCAAIASGKGGAA